MPTKHISEEAWKKVQDVTVKTVIETKTAIKDTDILNKLIIIGAKHAKEENYKDLIEK